MAAAAPSPRCYWANCESSPVAVQKTLLVCNRCGEATYCGRACQVAAWPEHKHTCSERVTTRACSGSGKTAMGMGLFARKNFVPGDVLVREKPLAKMRNPQVGRDGVTTPAELDESARRSIGALVAGMPEGKRRVAMRLADSHSSAADADDPGESSNDPTASGATTTTTTTTQSTTGTSTTATAHGVFRTNALPIHGGSHHALFALASRLNHSCRPNARWMWREDVQTEFVVAVREIAAGEEVTVSYVVNFYDARRRRELRQNFGFECDCSVCHRDGTPECKAVSDLCEAKRAEIDRALQQLPALANTPRELQRGAALRSVERILGLLVDVGLATPDVTHLLHYDAFAIAMEMERTKSTLARARQHLLRAAVAARLSEGPGSAACEKIDGKLRGVFGIDPADVVSGKALPAVEFTVTPDGGGRGGGSGVVPDVAAADVQVLAQVVAAGVGTGVGATNSNLTKNRKKKKKKKKKKTKTTTTTATAQADTASGGARVAAGDAPAAPAS